MFRRDMQPSGVDHMRMPTDANADEVYGQHVQMRTVMFLRLIYQVAALLLKAGLPGDYRSFLTDKASVQVGEGVYGDTFGKIDAAHLCNTSFEKDRFLAAYAMAHRQTPAAVVRLAEALYTQSGATTPQYKSNNVGPDKVIDGYQTAFKNWFLEQVQHKGGLLDYDDVRQQYLQGLKQNLDRAFAKKKPTSATYPGYTAACAAIDKQWQGQADWAVKEDVAKVLQDIAAL